MTDREQEEIISKFFTKDSEIYRTAVNICGEECVDIQRNGHGPELILHFPTLLLTNSLGEKHKVTDMYVRFYFYGSTFRTFQMNGMRMTCTREELVQRYCHSHLKTPYGNWHDFCQGNFLNDMVMNIHSSETIENLTYTILMLLNTLPTYLNEESLEGGPYQTMRNVYQLLEYKSNEIDVDTDFVRTYARKFTYMLKDGVTVVTGIKDPTGFPSQCYVGLYSPSLNQYLSPDYGKIDDAKLTDYNRFDNDSWLSRNRHIMFKGEMRFCDLLPTEVITDLEPCTNKIFQRIENQIIQKANEVLRVQLAHQAQIKIQS